MTIQTVVKCDGLDCRNTLEVDECDTPEITMKLAGWGTDPDHSYWHYCSICWPKVEKELKELAEAY